MTHLDVLVTIFSEVTNKPADLIRSALNEGLNTAGRGNADVEISDAEAEKLLAEMRTEKPGILNKLLEARNSPLGRLLRSREKN